MFLGKCKKIQANFLFLQEFLLNRFYFLWYIDGRKIFFSYKIQYQRIIRRRMRKLVTGWVTGGTSTEFHKINYTLCCFIETYIGKTILLHISISCYSSRNLTDLFVLLKNANILSHNYLIITYHWYFGFHFFSGFW